MDEPRNGVDYLVDYYAVLSVERGADSETIKHAYRELQKKYHPDLYQSLAADFREQAEARSRIIQEAYGILSDPEEKTVYDQKLSEWSGPVSENGNPVIDLRQPYFSPVPLITGDTADQPVNLSQFSGYDPNTFALIEKMYLDSENPSPELTAAYKEQLSKRDLHLALEEWTEWEKIGFHNQPTEDRPDTDYAADIQERLDVASRKVAESVTRALLMLQTGEVKLLVTGETGEEQALTIASPEEMEELRKKAEERFRRAGEKLKQLVEARGKLVEKRLKMIRLEYRPEQKVFYPQLALCVTGGAKLFWFSFCLRGDYIITEITDPGTKTEELEKLSDTAVAQEWIARGWNVAFVAMEDGIDVEEFVAGAAVRHFEKLSVPEQTP